MSIFPRNFLLHKIIGKINLNTSGSIPVGIKGWVVEKFGKKCFTPDEGQEGLDLFTQIDQPNILIPYKKIEDSYKII